MANKSAEILPEEGHKDVGREVFNLLDAVVRDKEAQQLPSKWHRFYELGKNKHWRSPNKKLSLTSANFISVHRRRTINTLTDNHPTFNVRRVITTDDTDEKFQKLLRTTEYWWNETEQQDILEESIHNGETYGACFEKVFFNLEAEYGIGEVETLIVDPYYIGVYPVKSKDIQKASAVLHYYPMSVREARRLWPDSAKLIQADADVIENMGEERRFVNGMKNTLMGSGSKASTTFLGVIRNLLSPVSGEKDVYSEDEVLVVECWVKDYSVEVVEIPVDEETVEEISKPKYPGYIRCITAVNGHLVVSDRKNPSINPDLEDELAQQTYLYDKFPFAKANSNKDPVNFWGESDFEQLAGIQMELNKSLSQFSSLKDKVAGVKLINPKTSGVNNSKFSAGPTIINPETVNHGIDYLKPPPIPKELMESVDIYKELFLFISGSFDMEQANSPGKQVIAYQAIAALLEKAATMMRGKVRNYSKLVRDRGRMAVSLMQNWYTEERYITYEDGGDEMDSTVIGRDMIVPMKLTVVSGSTMPKSDVQRREEAISLFEKNAIDNLELLKRLGWEKPNEVVTRLSQGPVGEFISKMMETDMPQEIAQYMQEVAGMDGKKLTRSVERHEVPLFSELFQFEGVQPDRKKELELQRTQAEIEESRARMEKALADAEKIIAIAEKERESIRQTDERIKIDRAKIVNEIRKADANINKGESDATT